MSLRCTTLPTILIGGSDVSDWWGLMLPWKLHPQISSRLLWPMIGTLTITTLSYNTIIYEILCKPQLIETSWNIILTKNFDSRRSALDVFRNSFPMGCVFPPLLKYLWTQSCAFSFFLFSHVCFLLRIKFYGHNSNCSWSAGFLA